MAIEREKENWWERVQKGEPWWSKPWPEKFETYEISSALSLKLEDYLWEGSNCMGCMLCRYMEPIYMREGRRFIFRCPPLEKEKWDIYGLVGKMKVVPQILQTGVLEFTPTLYKAAFSCMLCGACEVGCKEHYELEAGLFLEALRIRCVEEMGVDSKLDKRVQLISSKNNYWGREPKDRLNWLPQGAKRVKKADVLYFVGCCSSYVNPEIAEATARILSAAGNFMIMDDERCCGNPIYSSGQLDKAKAWAEENLRRLRESRAKTVVCSCAECYHNLKVNYPKMLGISTADLGFEVVHLVEFVDRMLKEGKISFKNRVALKLTYHDSCHLARKSEPWIPWEGKRYIFGLREPEPPIRRGTNGVYQPQRDILTSIPGIELTETQRIRENAWCCGGGGGVMDYYPELTEYAAAERIEEASVITGATAIVAACPRCKANFSAAVKKRGEGIREVYDISELILKGIGG